MFGALPTPPPPATSPEARSVSSSAPSSRFRHTRDDAVRVRHLETSSDPADRRHDPCGSCIERTGTRSGGLEEREIDSAVNQMWRDYVSTRDPALRERLVAHYMQGHVYKVAERMKAQLPRQVEFDDLLQEGYLGLVAAIERFQPDRAVRFETFSSRRIFGAMRDYLRDLDPIPRLTRLRFKKLEQAKEAFRKEHGREPDQQELRVLLRHVTRRVERAISQGRPPAMVSFNSPQIATETGQDGDAMTGFADANLASPLQRAELEDLRRWITQGLARRDRLILILYYYEQMTMKDIGMTLGCSESRVSQRLESIKDCLRSRLQHTGAEREFMAK
jgi:RNA polymerase sigma factor for flagellar operon FliA